MLLSVFMYGRALDARRLQLAWQRARKVRMGPCPQGLPQGQGACKVCVCGNEVVCKAGMPGRACDPGHQPC